MPNQSKKPLTNLQERFVNNILKGLNQTDAYLKAGYKTTKSAARRNSARLMTKDDIQSAVREVQDKASYKAEITAERILKEEACIAYQKVGTIFELKKGVPTPPNELPEHVQRAVAGVEIIESPNGETKYKYKFWDKGRSLERLEKYMGMFEEDNRQKHITIEEILAVLPTEYAGSVHTALVRLLSER